MAHFTEIAVHGLRSWANRATMYEGQGLHTQTNSQDRNITQLFQKLQANTCAMLDYIYIHTKTDFQLR